MTLNEIAEKAYETALKRGQYQGDVKDALLHLVTEVGELVGARKKANYGIYEELRVKMGFKEAYEFGIKNTIEDEISDILILTLGLTKALNIDADTIVNMKMLYNEERI